jgi:hypothetical protein
MKQHFLHVALLAGLLASCTPHQQQGAALGGLAGGALGAVAGGDSEAAITGAALGAGLGAGIAAMQENQRAKASTRDYAPRDYTPPMSTSDYPYAEKTRTPGEVISPYAPYNVMDVRGLRPGSLALDPSSKKKFRVP